MDVKLLLSLCDARGVSGDETEVRDLLRQRVGGRVDTLGNLVVTRPDPAGGPGVRLMVAAHMDEVGFMITRVEKNGRLRFATVGGIDPRVLPGLPVLIGRDRAPGVIGIGPPHLLDRDGPPPVAKVDDLLIDAGCSSQEEAERWFKVGDYAAFTTAARETGDGCVLAKALDDRAGCAILLQVLQEEYPGVELHAVFTVQEELGLRGARVAAHAVAPEVGLALEGTICAGGPGLEKPLQVTTLGAGAAISLMDRASIASQAMVKVLAEVAEQAGLPYQFRRSTMGGNDAGAINLALEGAPSAAVSVPCRYIHAPAALASLRDVEAAARLTAAFIRRIGAEGLRFRH